MRKFLYENKRKLNEDTLDSIYNQYYEALKDLPGIYFNVSPNYKWWHIKIENDVFKGDHAIELWFQFNKRLNKLSLGITGYWFKQRIEPNLNDLPLTKQLLSFIERNKSNHEVLIPKLKELLPGVIEEIRNYFKEKSNA